jgi:betaine-aldehyde dehydrogenase
MFAPAARPENDLRHTGTSNDVKTLRNYIGGEWTEAAGRETFSVVNPANGVVIAKAQSSGREDTRKAIDLAVEVRERDEWSTDSRRRCLALLKLADSMEEANEELSTLLTTENGKPLKLSKAEIDSSIDHVRFYAGLSRAVYGRSMGVDSRSFSIIAREPMGVVAHIVPWNYPVLLMFRALAASLAAGNVCIVKPASYTPVTTAMIVNMVDEISAFPKGVLSYVTGPGPIVGAELARSSKVDMVTMTGDNKTGKEILRLASEGVKKVGLELGGKSPNIVFPDADPRRAIEGALNGGFTVSGQVCFAGSRVLVAKGAHTSFVKSFGTAARALKVGNGLEASTDLGPIISKGQLEKVMGFIEIGRKDASLVTGGERLTKGALAHGNFVEPTIFDDVPKDSKLAQEEIFGPVVSVMEFEDEDEAIEMANDSKFGLAAAIWTNDVKRAFRVSRRIRAGTVWVNAFGRTFAETEYGGYKQSGIGRERGLDGLVEFTQSKHIYFDMT